MLEMKEPQLKELLESGEKVLLDFYTPSCGGCKVLAFQLERAEEDTEVPIIKVNAEEATDIAARFEIMNVPQLIVVENNVEVKRHRGFLPSEQIVEFVEA